MDKLFHLILTASDDRQWGLMVWAKDEDEAKAKAPNLMRDQHHLTIKWFDGCREITLQERAERSAMEMFDLLKRTQKAIFHYADEDGKLRADIAELIAKVEMLPTHKQPAETGA